MKARKTKPSRATSSKRTKRASKEARIQEQAPEFESVERPPCFREARFDENGFLVPMDDAELLSDATGFQLARSQRGKQVAERYLERYLAPTTDWPDGKDTVIAQRHASATVRESSIKGLLKQFRSLGISEKDAATLLFGNESTEHATEKLPAEIRLRLIEMGLLQEEISEVTRSALAVYQPIALFSLLALDPPIDKLEKPKVRHDKLPEVNDMRAFERLLPTLKTLGSRVIKSEILYDVLLILQKLMNARAVNAVEKIASARKAASLVDAMTPVREGGWTTAMVEFRRRKLSRLVSGLKAAEPHSWSIPRVAELILACERDWVSIPCPKLIQVYRDRPDDLEELIKKDLKRVAQSRNDKTGP